MLRKSPASKVWAAIFKNADFSWSSLKVTKFSNTKHILFLTQNSFQSPLLMVVPFSSEKLKDGVVELCRLLAFMKS